jgi:quinol monooxygenase YgiN
MIKRIVKLTLREDAAADFVAIFEASKATIRSFKGCRHVELWRQCDTSAVFFTYSVWAAPEYLEAYRQSEFFRLTWSKTKALFAAKAEAWSVDVVDQG